MFFRRTKVANGLDGKSYYTYRLVENQREGTKFRQKTMLNLGANWGVPQSDWKAVAQRVEAIQHGQISCFEYPKRIESAAQSVVNRLRARDLNGDKLGTGFVVIVDLDTMKHSNCSPLIQAPKTQQQFQSQLLRHDASFTFGCSDSNRLLLILSLRLSFSASFVQSGSTAREFMT